MHQTHNYFLSLSLTVSTPFICFVFLIHVLWLKCKFHYILYSRSHFHFFFRCKRFALFLFLLSFVQLKCVNGAHLPSVSYIFSSKFGFCVTQHTVFYSIFICFSTANREGERDRIEKNTHISHSSECYSFKALAFRAKRLFRLSKREKNMKF